jgi:hypothetical protein
MSRAIRTIAAAVALAAPVALSAPARAASRETVWVGGTGTIAPGLPCTDCVEHWQFTTVVAGTEANKLWACTWDGTSSGNVAAQQGTGTLSCAGATGTLSYTRTGPVLLMSGVLDVAGTTLCYDIALQWVPTSSNPTTSAVFGGGGAGGPC